MRTKIVGTPQIRVRAIAGTRTVLIAMDVAEPARKHLLGFAIHRAVGAEAGHWLEGTKVFGSVVPKPPKGKKYSTLDHPIQSLLWGDYTAEPATTYRYTIRPLYGTPKAHNGNDIVLEATTEAELDHGHGVWFNRGAIASQEYAQVFDNKPPKEPNNPHHKQTRWLARGLLDACLGFIKEAQAGDQLLVAAYEFQYPPILDALKTAIGDGVDVKVIYEAGTHKVKGVVADTEATAANKKAIAAAKFPAAHLIPRVNRKEIPHNKFIVRVVAGKAVSVWTGSTNFTASGFLGQTNVGHRIELDTIATKYFHYWHLLAGDPVKDELAPELAKLTPEPVAELPKHSVHCLFSPRAKATMLTWYASQITAADAMVNLTAAFGVDPTLAKALGGDSDVLRYILSEKPLTKKTKAAIGKDDELLVVYGDVLGEEYREDKKGELTLRRKIPGFKLTEWYLEEEHYRKTGHVFFVHSKFLLADALSDDPLVFTGSANFSDESLLDNDENMLLIRGNSRVADIYLTEFDRILRHYYFRDVAAETKNKKPRKGKFLAEDDSWLDDYADGRLKAIRQKEFFPG